MRPAIRRRVADGGVILPRPPHIRDRRVVVRGKTEQGVEGLVHGGIPDVM